MMNEKDVSLLKRAFKRYYFEHFEMIQTPTRTPEREFGYQKFGSGMIRHIPVRNEGELRLLLLQNVPSDVYCSNACYHFPNLPMAEKLWKEADLIFDIDAKDIGLPCREGHAVVVCNECGKVGQGQDCMACRSKKIKVRSLPCRKCMKGAGEQVDRLCKILTDDLGVDEGGIRIYFSGNEGYHVHVHDSQFQEMGSRERVELSDYIMFKGAVPGSFGMKPSHSHTDFPDPTERGWHGRFAGHVIRTKSAKSKILKKLFADDPVSFQEALAAASNSIGVKIDPNVTVDTHRIFRLPGSINSKSGLVKIQCKDPTEFDPYTSASLLDDDMVEVLADCPRQFSLRNKRFGPYSNENVSVPTYAAAYMICKGVARAAAAA